MKDIHKELFAPLTIRNVTLANRIVVPPMVQLRPITSPQGIAWYRRLASGGPGLVIAEATGVPLFGRELTAENLRPLTSAIHDGGSAAAIQLFPIPFGSQADPNELTVEQIEDILDRYATAAAICAEAGFDGVEPHGAHGFLINQFLMPDRNARTDDFGGSLENRSRFAVAIVDGIKRTTGDGLLILYRHTPVGEAYTIEDSLTLARRLIDAGADVLDISPAMAETVADLAAPFEARFDVPVIAVNGMENPADAAQAIRDGRCDLVAVGRQMIADARWPQLLRTEAFDQIRHCTKCNEKGFGNLEKSQPVECALWTDDELAEYML